MIPLPFKARIVVSVVGALVAGVPAFAVVPGDDKPLDAANAASSGSVSRHGEDSSADDFGASAAGCRVTKTWVARPPGVKQAGPGWIGRQGLWVNFGEKTTIAAPAHGHVPPPGAILGRVGKGGSIRAKVPWWRGRRAWGRLRVGAVSLPERDHLLRSRYDNHLGRRSKVVPGVMVFPHVGCWRVRARSGRAQFGATIWVTKVRSA